MEGGPIHEHWMLAGCESYLSPFCAAEQVLEDFHDRFITDVDASNVVFEFERKGVIPEGLLTAVNRETSATLQNQILYKHLAKTSTKDSLMIVCDVIIAVQGNPRMRAMGEDMKGKLQGEFLCVIHTCMHNCMRACVTWCAQIAPSTPSLSSSTIAD